MCIIFRKISSFILHEVFCTAQKWSFPLRISSVNNLVTFTVEILNGKLHFLCRVVSARNILTLSTLLYFAEFHRILIKSYLKSMSLWKGERALQETWYSQEGMQLLKQCLSPKFVLPLFFLQINISSLKIYEALVMLQSATIKTHPIFN